VREETKGRKGKDTKATTPTAAKGETKGKDRDKDKDKAKGKEREKKDKDRKDRSQGGRGTPQESAREDRASAAPSPLPSEDRTPKERPDKVHEGCLMWYSLRWE
jgi:hypothetical protein